MVTHSGPFPAGSPAAAVLGASENGFYVGCALPADAPFGAVEINVEGCTLCPEQDFDPYGAPPRPPVRTTEDYLREREAREREEKQKS